MTGADLPRRVERTEEDLTAGSDTVLETRGVVDQDTRLDALETRVAEGFAEALRRLDAR